MVLDRDEERLKTLQSLCGQFLSWWATPTRRNAPGGGDRARRGPDRLLNEDKDNLFITLSARVLNPELAHCQQRP